MVKLNKIYTRSGDTGTTGLADATRRPKHDPRIACIGAIDEANAALGLARQTNGDLDDLLARLQNELFDLGADLATPITEKNALRITPEAVARLEADIDRLNADLPPLESFILPGGTGGFLHLARATIRRAERDLAAAIEAEGADAFGNAVQPYINRVSDLLFVAARVVGGDTHTLWKPGGE